MFGQDSTLSVAEACARSAESEPREDFFRQILAKYLRGTDLPDSSLVTQDTLVEIKNGARSDADVANRPSRRPFGVIVGGQR